MSDTTEITTTESATLSTDYACNVVASFDLSTDEGQAKAYNAGIAADEKIADHIGETVNMVGYYVESISVVDDLTGEVTARPHCVIWADDGKTYEGQSKGLVSSLQRMSAVRPVVDDDNPVKVEFAERKARLGRMHVLRMV